MQHTYPSIGECIYCGSKENLSLEHIVPEGLGGRLLLPDASCGKCRDLTSRFERSVQRGGMWATRRVLNIKGKKRKEPPRDKFPINVEHDDGTLQTVNLPVSDHIGTLVTPIFPPATLRASVPVNETFNSIMCTVRLRQRMQQSGYGESAFLAEEFRVHLT